MFSIRGRLFVIENGYRLVTCRTPLGKYLDKFNVKSKIIHSGNASRARFCTSVAKYDHEKAFLTARDEPEMFWGTAAESLDWHKKWETVLDNSNPPFTKWFVGGSLNLCYNAVDRHVKEGHGDQVAVVYDSPITGNKDKLTYKQLLDQVSRFARVLINHGVQREDRVLIYMPMIPEALIAMLATARIGAIHSLVFGGFAAKELSTRINHAEPKVIVSSNCGVEPGRIVDYKSIIDQAIEFSAYKPPTVILYQRDKCEFAFAPLTRGRDYSWADEMVKAEPHDCVPVDAMHPLYVLYTSGTTGLPKAVVRPSAGHAVTLHWSMYNIFGMKPGETWWAASDLGWVVGHSYICYAPLLHRNTTVLFEGKPVGTPDAGVFFRVLHDYNVSGMFTAPTALRAIRREDPTGIMSKKYDLSKFRYLFVAGEHCDRETLEWTRSVFKSPILDNWWQTETGFPMSSTCIGLGNDLNPPPGMAGKPVPGWNLEVIDKNQEPCEPDEMGNIVVRLPLPPGSFSTLWNADQRFIDTYFTKYDGYYDTQDAGYMDEEGNIAIMSRIDDVINVAGHRLSTGQLEEAMLEMPDLAECAVVGVDDKLKGQVPLGICVLKHGVERPHDEIIEEVVNCVRDHVGPVAAFKQAIVVKKLPKTRSGKVARNTIAAMAAGKPFKIPVTIEDASVYPEIKSALRDIGLPTEQRATH